MACNSVIPPTFSSNGSTSILKEVCTTRSRRRATISPEIPPCELPMRHPNDKLASFGGHGTLEILKVTQILEENDISCCLVGVSALIFYGADRGRDDWEICIPTAQLEIATSLLKSIDDYLQVPHLPFIQPRSLLHTFPRFKRNGYDLFFVLVPSYDSHLDCKSKNFTRSLNGLPYPKLELFVQSLLDMHDMVALCDVVDGADISEEWAIKNLDLTGSNDLDWVQWKNNLIREHAGEDEWFSGIETSVFSRRDSWEETVRGKSARLGFKHNREVFATRFRLHGSPDPWLTYRTAA